MTTRRPPSSTRRSTTGFVVSIAVHLLVIAALGQITLGSRSLIGFFRERSAPEAERVEYVRVVPVDDAAGAAGRTGGDGRRITTEPRRDPPPLVAPVSTPTSVPAIVDTAAEPIAERGGRGPLVGGGGPLRGIQPGFSDPVFWAPLGAVVLTPKTRRQQVDSSIVAEVSDYLDSLASIPAQRDPSDWTVERDGKRWGIDREYIRLGDVSIPTSVLALLPLNVQGNPISLERERAIASQRADIQFHVQRAIARDEVKAAVQRIRTRVEAERAARAKIAQRGPVRPPPDQP